MGQRRGGRRDGEDGFDPRAVHGRGQIAQHGLDAAEYRRVVNQ
jgi:hypothetical protein